MQHLSTALLVLLCLFGWTERSAGQTVLTAGDLAITSYQSDNPDVFSFVVLRPGGLASGTEVRFTDNGWTGTAFRTGEGVRLLTFTSAVPQFTVVTLTFTATPTIAPAVATLTNVSGSFDLSTAGDQLLMYQGTEAAPVFITAIQMNVENAGTFTPAGWDGGSTSANMSAIPTGLTNGVDAVAVVNGTTEFDNARYDCAGAENAPSLAAMRAAINNAANWTKDDNLLTPATAACTFSLCILPDMPTINASSTAICPGGGVVLSIASGNLNYASNWHWYEGACGGTPVGTGSAVSVAPLVTTTYYVRGEGACFAAGTCAEVTIVVSNILPNVQMQPGCFNTCNGALTAAPSGGQAPYTYQWSNGAGNQASVQNLCAGNYGLTLTDAIGCSVSAVSMVSAQQFPTQIAISRINNVCHGDCNGEISLNVLYGTAPYTYQWSTNVGSPVAGQTAATLTGLCQGSYNVTVTDANGCVTLRPFILVLQPAAIATSFTTTPDGCNPGTGSASVTATGGTAPYTYLWSNGSTAAGINNLTAGNYTVTVTDAVGCQRVSSILVDNTCFSISISKNDPCGNSCTGTAVVNVSGGVAPYTYQWSNNLGNGASLNGLCPGTRTVTVTDATGAVRTASVTIQYNPMTASYTSTRPSCVGACDGTATVNVMGGTAPYTYQWQNGQTAQTAAGLCQSSNTVTITDAAGCVLVRTSVFVLNPTQIVLNASSTPSGCNPDGTAMVQATGGAGAYTYMWSNQMQSNSISGLAPGVYTVTVTDGNGCQRTASVTVGNNCGGANPLTVMGNNGMEELNGAVEVENSSDINTVLSLNDFPQVSAFNVYPNPNQGQFTIDIELAAETEARLRIHDVLGRTIHEENLQGQFFRLPVHAGAWEPGAYYVQLVSRDGQTTRRVVIAK